MKKYIPLYIILMISIIISGVMRIGFIEFTPNGSYLKIGSIYQNKILGEFYTPGVAIGSPVYGKGGFPFRTYICQIAIGGTQIIVQCRNKTNLGELANIYNIIFWFLLLSIGFYCFSIFLKK